MAACGLPLVIARVGAMADTFAGSRAEFYAADDAFDWRAHKSPTLYSPTVHSKRKYSKGRIAKSSHASPSDTAPEQPRNDS
jgi:hypothetical protein